MPQAALRPTSIHTLTPVNRPRVFNRNFNPALACELYIVIDRDGYVRERSPEAMTKRQTIRDILSGEFSVRTILCVYPDENISRDVTEDMAREVLNASDGPLRGHAWDYVEDQLGFAAAREAV